jgi:DNA polymerase III alpha subunit
METGLTIGKHPMHYRRQALCRQGVLTASELQKRRNGEYVKTAGLAIVKQRPGTAKGVVFMSATDETGIFNIIVSKDFLKPIKWPSSGASSSWSKESSRMKMMWSTSKRNELPNYPTMDSP